MLIIKNSENREKALAYIRVSSQRQADEGVPMCTGMLFTRGRSPSYTSLPMLMHIHSSKKTELD